MPIQRKHDFKAGTKISSDQVDEELNQLVSQSNQLESDLIESEEGIRDVAQLIKITTDTGDAKLSISDTSKDLLDSLVSLGSGLHSFYAVTGTQNAPPGSGSIRGLFHQTSLGHGWVMAIDYNNNPYTNYMANGNWTGWNTRPFLDVSKTDDANISVNTWTKIIPNTLTSHIGGGTWGGGTYTIPSTGVYEIYMSVSMAGMIAGHSIYTAAYVNGNLYDKARIGQRQTAGENDGIVVGSTMLHLSRGDKLDFWVYQNSAGVKTLKYSYIRVAKIQ